MVNGAVGGRLESASDVFSEQLNALLRNIAINGNNIKTPNIRNNDHIHSKSKEEELVPPQSQEAKCYIENTRINFGKLITDEILAADYKLVQAARKAVIENFVIYFNYELSVEFMIVL